MADVIGKKFKISSPAMLNVDRNHYIHY